MDPYEVTKLTHSEIEELWTELLNSVAEAVKQFNADRRPEVSEAVFDDPSSPYGFQVFKNTFPNRLRRLPLPLKTTLNCERDFANPGLDIKIDRARCASYKFGRNDEGKPAFRECKSDESFTSEKIVQVIINPFLSDSAVTL